MESTGGHSMKKEDEKQFSKIMAGLQEVYTPEKPISTAKLEIYWMAFQDWTIEQFQAACQALLQTKTISTFPLPGEIRAASQEKDRALEAWLLARNAISICTNTASVIFSDAVIHSVIEAMGGWPKFCWIQDDELPFRQKDFLEYYKFFASKQRHPAFVQGAYQARDNMIDLRGGKVRTLSADQAQAFLEGHMTIETSLRELTQGVKEIA